MLAIFQAILPQPVAVTAELHTQIATLASLRLLVKAGTATDGLEGKFRVNVPAGLVRGLAASIGVDVELDE
jgi:origin recognition complex subunit 5